MQNATIDLRAGNKLTTVSSCLCFFHRAILSHCVRPRFGGEFRIQESSHVARERELHVSEILAGVYEVKSQHT